jgi:hypothetical protein
MLIGLLTLYFIVFGRGHETFLLNPNLEKNVGVYVKDKDRRTQIDQTIKQVEKSEEAFQKKAKDVYDKKLKELNLNRNSTAPEFSQQYSLLYQDLGSLQSSYVDAEIKIRTFIRSNEWDSIMNKVLKQPDNAKARKSLMEENKKLHDKLLETCNKRITDAAGRAKAKTLVDEYMVKGDSLASAFLDLNYKYLKAVRPYKVTPQDFLTIRNTMIGLRKNYSAYLVSMRFKLLAIVPEKEWEGLAKELNDNFDYLGPGISR